MEFLLNHLRHNDYNSNVVLPTDCNNSEQSSGFKRKREGLNVGETEAKRPALEGFPFSEDALDSDFWTTQYNINGPPVSMTQAYDEHWMWSPTARAVRLSNDESQSFTESAAMEVSASYTGVAVNSWNPNYNETSTAISTFASTIPDSTKWVASTQMASIQPEESYSFDGLRAMNMYDGSSDYRNPSGDAVVPSSATLHSQQKFSFYENNEQNLIQEYSNPDAFQHVMIQHNNPVTRSNFSFHQPQNLASSNSQSELRNTIEELIGDDTKKSQTSEGFDDSSSSSSEFSDRFKTKELQLIENDIEDNNDGANDDTRYSHERKDFDDSSSSSSEIAVIVKKKVLPLVESDTESENDVPEDSESQLQKTSSNIDTNEPTEILESDSLSMAFSNDEATQNHCTSDRSDNEFHEPSTSHCNKKRRTRKRLRDPSKWKHNVAKVATNSGKGGVSKKGRKIKPKPMGKRCEHSDHDETQIPEAERVEMYNSFWLVKKYRRQMSYIETLVQKHPPTRRRVQKHSRKKYRKQSTYSYVLVVKNVRIPVCRKLFLSTFGINVQWIKTIECKRLQNPMELLQPDQRGKHKNRPHKIPQAVIDSITKHIKKFPKMDSHYCRESTTREYLEDSLNINKMYKLFLAWDEAKIDTSKVKAHLYRQVFTTKFNLYFHRPKKDQCSDCNGHEALAVEEQEANQVNVDKHLLDNDIARDWMKIDARKARADKSNQILVASFDLQKVLPMPRSHTSVMFYKRKISVFNFTIYDFKTKQGYCYVWNETEANRGANEVGSCLWHFIKQRVDKGYTDFRFYSDNCAGQNRNQYLFTMYVKAAMEFNITIQHRFLVKGHTETAGDSMHSTNERAISTKRLYTVQQYCSEMKSCKNKEPHYEVHEMGQQEIYNFSLPSQSKFWKKMKVSQLCEIKIYPDKKMEYRYDYESKEPFIINIPEGNDKEKGSLVPCNTNKLPLDSNKVKDLESLMRYIPHQHHDYYKNLMY